jgi:hypothetical protein
LIAVIPDVVQLSQTKSGLKSISDREGKTPPAKAKSAPIDPVEARGIS